MEQQSGNFNAFPIYVLFLLDDSNAINDEHFSIIGALCDRMCNELSTPQLHFGAIAFHSSSFTIADFTPDRVGLLKRIHAYKRKRGSQNINSGLDSALKLFGPIQAKRNAKKICCIFTNGSASWVQSQQAQLRQMKIVTYCIGIDSRVTIDKLQKNYIYDCTVMSSEVAKIISLINPAAPNEIPRLQVELETKLTKSPIKFQEYMPMTVTVKNIGPNLIPADTNITFFGGDYFKNTTYLFENDIEHGESFSFQITMQTTGKSFSLISDAITFKIFHPVGEKIYCSSKDIPLRSEDFIGSYTNFKPTNPSVESLNILLFGIVGCGKSSFLNAIVSAFSSQIKDPCVVGGDEEHITVEYHRFKMGDQIDSLPKLPINLWDTWGLDLENYTGELLAKLLEGDVPSTFEMKHVRNDGHIVAIEDNLSPAERRIHGVLLLVPIGILEDEALVMRLKGVLREMNRKNHQTLIIATCADLVAPDLLWAHRHAIAGRFNLPDYKVHLVINYTETREKTFSIDKVTLAIFAEIVQIADTYAKTYLERPLKKKEDPPDPHNLTTLRVDKKGKTRVYEDEPLRMSVLVNFGGKTRNFNVNETTTFESLLTTVAQKAKIDPSEYCLASQEEGGVEYALKDLVRAALSERETTLFVCKNQFD